LRRQDARAIGEILRDSGKRKFSVCHGMRGRNYAKTIARSLAAAAICLGSAVKRTEAVERDRSSIKGRHGGITFIAVFRAIPIAEIRSTIRRAFDCFAEPLLLAN